MASRGLGLLVALVGLLAWAAFRRPPWMPRAVVELSAEAKQDLEQEGIRYSGRFLHSMGAVESAPRAEMDALLAHRVATAILKRLQAAVPELKVMVIGGVIHMEGTVSSPTARTEAERVAREVSGAQVIADDLRVL